jgi:hypothetical protein
VHPSVVGLVKAFADSSFVDCLGMVGEKTIKIADKSDGLKILNFAT